VQQVRLFNSNMFFAAIGAWLFWLSRLLGLQLLLMLHTSRYGRSNARKSFHVPMQLGNSCTHRCSSYSVAGTSSACACSCVNSCLVAYLVIIIIIIIIIIIKLPN
jgi:hypothetical protein